MEQTNMKIAVTEREVTPAPRVPRVRTLKRKARELGLMLVWEGTPLDDKWTQWHKAHANN